MRNAKKILAFFLLIVLALSLSACKEDEQTIIGKWNVDKDGLLSMTGLTEEEFDQFAEMGIEQTVTMEYGNDGIVTITMSVAGQYVKDFLPYEIKDGKLYVDGDPASYTIKGNTLTIAQDDIVLTLTKAK